MTVLGPLTPEALRPLLREFAEALAAWRAPPAPTPLFACAAADLPPAAAWPRRMLLVSDLNIIAHSDGSAWIRQDTGGPV